MKMPNMCPFEKKEKEVFFRLPTFFFRNKIQGTNLVQFFMYFNAKKNFGAIQKKFFFENLLSNFRKCFFKNFRIAPNFFFAL